MKKWTKKQALSSLKKLIEENKRVRSYGRNSQEHIRWLANSLRILEEIFGHNSRYYSTLSSYSWSKTGKMILDVWDMESQINKKHNDTFLRQMEQSVGLLWAAIDHLKDSEVEDVYDGKNTALEASELIQIINLGENKLRKLFRSTPEKESEVQDKYEDLLIANDINYSREFPHIEYSSKQYIPDFSIKKLDLVIEIKLCRKDEKTFIAQINDDILAYKTKFKNIIFVIYDLGKIRDVDTFKNSLEKHTDVIVQIIKE